MDPPTTTVVADTAVTLPPAATPRSPTGAAARSKTIVRPGDSEDNSVGSLRQIYLQL